MVHTLRCEDLDTKLNKHSNYFPDVDRLLTFPKEFLSFSKQFVRVYAFQIAFCIRMEGCFFSNRFTRV